MTLRIQVDVANPGQFFACCGLFELAHRLAPNVRAHFDGDAFVVEGATLDGVVDAFLAAPVVGLDPGDATASPLRLGAPFELTLDWWKDTLAGGRDLKVWAGTMQCERIFVAMRSALANSEVRGDDLLRHAQVVYDPDDLKKKVEPFYFDARRAPNAHSRDVGFSPNDLGLTTTASPAVESLTLLGLQRFRPAATNQRRVFDYVAWTMPLPITLAAAAAGGSFDPRLGTRFRFEAWFRTGQKKHKAFKHAAIVPQEEAT